RGPRRLAGRGGLRRAAPGGRPAGSPGPRGAAGDAALAVGLLGLGLPADAGVGNGRLHRRGRRADAAAAAVGRVGAGGARGRGGRARRGPAGAATGPLHGAPPPAGRLGGRPVRLSQSAGPPAGGRSRWRRRPPLLRRGEGRPGAELREPHRLPAPGGLGGGGEQRRRARRAPAAAAAAPRPWPARRPR
ncbi:unnamed protein product, partial [Prorocentrum cordatum]